MIASLLDGLSGPTQRARVWRGLTESGAVERTMSEHLAIVEAIESRQPHVAHAWSTVHISGIETWLRTTLGTGKFDLAAPPDATKVATSMVEASG